MNVLSYSILPALALSLFSVLLAGWIQFAKRPDGQIESAIKFIGGIAFGLYLVWMAVITIEQGQIPIETLGQLSAFLGFLVWAGQGFVQLRIQQRLLGILPTSSVILLLVVALVAGLQPQTVPTSVLTIGAAFHVTLALGGISMLLGSGVFGAGTLILHRQIARRTFGSFFSLMPPMEDMNRLRATAVYAGWVLVTLSLASAILWTALVGTETHVVISHLHPMLTLWTVTTALALTTRFGWIGQYRLALSSVGLAALVLLLVMISVIEIFSGAWL